MISVAQMFEKYNAVRHTQLPPQMHATHHLHTTACMHHSTHFLGLRQVLRGLQSDSDFLKNNMVRLCCPKGISEQYQGDAKIFEPANGEIKFEQAKAAVNKYTTTLQCARAAH